MMMGSEGRRYNEAIVLNEYQIGKICFETNPPHLRRVRLHHEQPIGSNSQGKLSNKSRRNASNCGVIENVTDAWATSPANKSCTFLFNKHSAINRGFYFETGAREDVRLLMIIGSCLEGWNGRFLLEKHLELFFR